MTIQFYPNKRNFAALSDQQWSTVATKNDHYYSQELGHNTQLDESFEPIAVVTPPKKRTKSDTYAPYNVATMLSGTGAAHQRRNSFQLLDFVDNNHGSYRQMNSTDRYALDSMSSMPFMHSMPSVRPIRSLQPLPALYGNTMPPLNRGMTSSVFNGMSDSVLNSLTGGGKILGKMESPFNDERSALQGTSEHCPDLCASSSSSSLEKGQYIIQASDSLKENGFKRAEVIVGPGDDLNILKLIKNANNRKSRGASPASADASPVPTASKQKEKITPPLKASLTRSTEKEGSSRFKPFHEEKWSFHFEELCAFKQENGHCLVPHTFPEKPHLARWVKRQRRQYKLRLEGNTNSTMTEERIKILNDIGFVWDSHEVIWNERFAQLVAYKQKCGHCRVPSYCKECPQLASWVKCQRRQYKLYWEDGKGSSMNPERIKLLNSIGFIWEVHPSRKQKDNNQHFQHLANILMDS